MGRWDKLIQDILNENPNLRFDDLKKALLSIGYAEHQPSGGSSHYTFRKEGCKPITIPKQKPIKRVYIRMVAEAVQAYLEESSHE